MKRVYIATFVLLSCLALSLFSYFTIINSCKTLINKSESVIKSMENGDFSSAEKENEEIQHLWQKYTFSFSLLTTHFHYDSLEESIDKLNREIKAKNSEQIKESASQLIFDAKHIITTIKPKPENVF